VAAHPPAGTFTLTAELEPPAATPSDRLARQIASLAPVADRFLVPDNHLGRATVSSIVLAAEVQAGGHRAVACLNARDRNLLGLRRDLLTAAHLGVRDLLLVHGDEPSEGTRAGDLTVRRMLGEAHAAGASAAVTTRLGPLPAWKRDADELYVQVAWSVPDVVRWREQVAFEGPVHVGVLVLSGVAMAERLARDVPQLRPPARVLEALARDGRAGVPLAAGLLAELRASGACDGAHLIAGVRHAELAGALAAPLG
jgi:5,10-methylenetetrahydrofolate reductase